MKFFTPDLIERYNSQDDAAIDAASDQWDKAQDVYVQELEQLLPQLSGTARAVLDLDLHDASFPQSFIFTGHGRNLSIPLLLQSGQSGHLVYDLTGRMNTQQHPPLATADPPQWWYDEIDRGADGSFVHSVLLSNGLELKIPFSDLKWIPESVPILLEQEFNKLTRRDILSPRKLAEIAASGIASTAAIAAAATAAAAPAPTVPPGVQPKLVVLRGLKINVEYPVYQGNNFIGRADEQPVDVDLDDQEPPDRVWSSRQHCLIVFENSTLQIEDLNSANGTFVNRVRVYPGQRKGLAPGDVLQVGTVQLRVKV